MEIPLLQLNTGFKIPQFGFGTFSIPPEQTKNACLEALKAGYRHIDTAHAYYNESGVGEALKECGIPREEIFITTKLWHTEYGEGLTLPAIDKMLTKLQTSYIDLLLLHQPLNDYKGAWKEMEKAVKAGKVRSIGLSNFDNELYDDIISVCTIKPAAFQVECHPLLQQTEFQKKISSYGAILEAWYPLCHGDKDVINNSLFTKLAKKYNKTNAQIILRWHIQEGHVVFPKSTNPIHMKENINIFDFKIDDEDMELIREMGKINKRYINIPLSVLASYDLKD